MLVRGEKSAVLWSFGGLKAHATLLAALPGDIAESATVDNETITFGRGVGTSVFDGVDVAGVLPQIAAQAVDGFKFSAALPRELAVATLAARFVDREGAALVGQAKISVRVA